MRVWANGTVLADPGMPAVAVTDHGFTVGDGVFESVKVVDSMPFALSRHLRRLATSARGLGLEPPDEGVVRGAVAQLLEGQTLSLGRLRITWTAGPGPMGSGRDAGVGTLVVVADTLAPWEPSTAIATVPWPRNERGALAGLKTTSYAENVIALAAARERGASEAIFADTRGNLCEGTGSNVFYVLDGELRTPALSTGCLAGITRELVLEWVGAVECEEPIGVLAAAEEIFLASTTRDVQPVSRCDGRDLTAPGPATSAAVDAFAAGAAADLDP